MNVRAPRPREAVVGLAFLSAALLLLATGLDGRIIVAGSIVGSRAVAAAFLVAGFTVAAALSLEAGDHRQSVGDIAAVAGWFCLLLASLTPLDVLASVGVVLVLGAGVFLVLHGLGVRPAAPASS